MLCFFASGRVLGKQQKSPSSKPQHVCVIISLEKLASCFHPFSRRASSYPCDAFTLTALWDNGSISSPWDCWPQRPLSLAHTLAAYSAHGHLPPSAFHPSRISPAVPSRLVAVEQRVVIVSWARWQIQASPLHHWGRHCLLECANTAAVYCFVFQGKPSVHSGTQGISTIFLNVHPRPHPPLAFGHTHCVVLT